MILGRPSHRSSDQVCELNKTFPAADSEIDSSEARQRKARVFAAKVRLQFLLKGLNRVFIQNKISLPRHRQQVAYQELEGVSI